LLSFLSSIISRSASFVVAVTAMAASGLPDSSNNRALTLFGLLNFSSLFSLLHTWFVRVHRHCELGWNFANVFAVIPPPVRPTRIRENAFGLLKRGLQTFRANHVRNGRTATEATTPPGVEGDGVSQGGLGTLSCPAGNQSLAGDSGWPGTTFSPFQPHAQLSQAYRVRLKSRMAHGAHGQAKAGPACADKMRMRGV